MGARARKYRLRHMGASRFIVSCIAAIAACLLLRPISAEAKGQSIIYVVDSSERMAPYLPNIKDAIFMHANHLDKGDYIGIISFTDSARVLTLKRISGPADLKSLELMLNALEASGDKGNAAKGVAHALDELAKLKRRGDENVKGIIVSASSQTPEEIPAEDILKEAHGAMSQYVGPNEWYIQYCYLNGVIDDPVKAFAEENRGFSFDVDALQSEHRSEMIEELYNIVSSPKRTNNVTIIDQNGAVMTKASEDTEWTPIKIGARIPDNTQVRVPGNSRAVIFLSGHGRLGLSPDTELIFGHGKENPLTGEGEFLAEIRSGSIWINLKTDTACRLTLDTPSAPVRLSNGSAVAEYAKETDDLLITSFSPAFKVEVQGASPKSLTVKGKQSVRIGQIIGEVETAEAYLTEKWKPWKKALFLGTPVAALDFTIPELIIANELIEVGPISSGEQETLRIPMQLVGATDTSGLSIEADISLALPEGLVVSSGIVDGNAPNERTLVLKLDGTGGFSSRKSDIFKGIIKMAPAADSRIAFADVPLQIEVKTKGPLAPRSVLMAGLAALIAIIVGAVIMVALRTREAARPKPHSVVGRLIVINDPTGGRVGTINLEEVSTKSSRLSIVVGKEKTDEVRLRHTSINPDHCTIEAHLVGGRLETFIEPIGSAKVSVDGESIHSKTRLADGSKVTIGEFEYQFEDSQFYKKVEVVRRNGRRLSGILDAAGMDAEGFRLSPIDAVSPSERARVTFQDIRHVIFYRRVADILSGAPRSAPKLETMKKVELMFKKGNTMSGYVQREYTEGRRRFVELIPLDPKSEIDYTVVDYSTVVEKKNL